MCRCPAAPSAGAGWTTFWSAVIAIVLSFSLAPTAAQGAGGKHPPWRHPCARRAALPYRQELSLICGRWERAVTSG